MKCKTTLGIMITLLLASTIKMFSVGPVSAVLAVHNLNTGLHYATIQEAIDAPQTLNGHTIKVDSGIYNELVNVKKALKIVGENKETTIIDGNEAGIVVNLTSTSVTITGFTIRNGGEGYVGIQMDTSGGHNISGNIVSNCVYGIDLFESSNNIVVGNILLDNGMIGISLAYSSNNNISDNYIYGSTYGIKIDSSSVDNDVFSNTVSETSYGIVMNNSGTNIVGSNNVSGKVTGIYSTYSSGNNVIGNIVWESAFAIEFYGGTSSNVLGNTVSASGYGIYLAFASGITVDGNLASNNDWGVYLHGADSNTIKNNTAAYNKYYGLTMVSDSNGNFIYFNNLIHNVKQLFQDASSGGNTWYKPVGVNNYGNYWTDYNGLDTDKDGVGETQIPHAGVDNYPLMNPTMTVHDVAIINVKTSATTVIAGQVVIVTVIARNEGTVNETFILTAKYFNRIIGTQTVTNLTLYASTTLTFNWDTTDVPSGFNYQISADASVIAGETDQIDNTKIDGTVEVKERIIGDVNMDGTVDLNDLILLNKAYGSHGPDYNYPGEPASPNWNQDADLNKDNIINGLDLFMLSKNYGK